MNGTVYAASARVRVRIRVRVRVRIRDSGEPTCVEGGRWYGENL